MLTKHNLTLSDEDRLKIIEAKTKIYSEKTEENAFYEMCFCICSPQTHFNKNSAVNQELRKRDFYHNYIPYAELSEICYSVRFFQKKAIYLIEAKQRWESTWYAIKRDSTTTDYDKRLYLVRNIKGLGMKTASHFLRNALGCEHFAILDTHVLKFMGEERPKNQWGYYQLEGKFTAIATKFNLTPTELDIYIFSHYANIPLEKVR
jgi:N-glycosylase/DNA lyase